VALWRCCTSTVDSQPVRLAHGRLRSSVPCAMTGPQIYNSMLIALSTRPITLTPHTQPHTPSHTNMSANAIVHMPVYAQTTIPLTFPLMTTYAAPQRKSGWRKRMQSSTTYPQLYVPVLMLGVCVRVAVSVWPSLRLLGPL
jgi:hypothetical protein